jgi:hypothetical protein
MAHLTIQDVIVSIRQNRLNQILDVSPTDDGTAIFDRAARKAEAKLIDKLIHYDTDVIFAKTADERYPTILTWLMHLTLYYIYERIADENVPPRIIKNYEDTMDELDKIAEGKQSANLPRKVLEDGSNKTKFRWGSVNKRVN